MKKHKLLEFAYDNYPKGTVARFKSAPDVDHVSDGKFQIQTNIGNGTVVLSGNGQECFYASNEKEGEQWAEIVSDKKPLLISMDGVPLFEGDNYYYAYDLDKKWILGSEPVMLLNRGCGVVIYPDRYKAFSTLDAAIKWIEGQQPKEMKFKLYGGKIAKINSHNIVIENPRLNNSMSLAYSDIEDISNALKTLSK